MASHPPYPELRARNATSYWARGKMLMWNGASWIVRTVKTYTDGAWVTVDVIGGNEEYIWLYEPFESTNWQLTWIETILVNEDAETGWT